MSASAVLDVTRPESAQGVGTELAASTQVLVARYGDHAITDIVALEQAVLDRQELGDAMKRVEAFFKPFKQMADRLHAALCEREREILAPLRRIDKLKADAMSTYKIARDQARREQERAQAEQQRREREAQAAHEAAALEQRGEDRLAAAILQEAIEAPEPVVSLPDPMRAVEGLRFTRTWHWKYAGGPADLKQTPPECRTRTMKLIPREFLTVDESKLTKYATNMKDTATVPGIDFYYRDTPRR